MPEQAAPKYPARVVVNALRAAGYLISKALWFIKYRGLENIPDPSIGGVIIAANHQTYIDPVWICPPLRHRKFSFMAFEKAFGWRLIGPLIKYLGAFPVSSEAGGIRKSMTNALASLHDGAALIVFPEGGREFADGKLIHFKPGVVRLAEEARVPILPYRSPAAIVFGRKSKNIRAFSAELRSHNIRSGIWRMIPEQANRKISNGTQRCLRASSRRA